MLNCILREGAPLEEQTFWCIFFFFEETKSTWVHELVVKKKKNVAKKQKFLCSYNPKLEKETKQNMTKKDWQTELHLGKPGPYSPTSWTRTNTYKQWTLIPSGLPTVRTYGAELYAIWPK